MSRVSWHNDINDFHINSLETTLEKFTSIGTNYLYDLEPRTENLFFAGWFGSNNCDEVSVAPFRIQSINVGLPLFSTAINPHTRGVNIDKIAVDTTIKISWVEDVYRNVQRYHYDWMSQWYNKKRDRLVNGVGSKFRRLRIVGFHYIQASNNNNKSYYISSPKIEPLYVISIGGMVPEDFQSLNFSYATDSNDQALDISYKASRIDWDYFPATRSGWLPKNVTVYADQPENNSPEESLLEEGTNTPENEG